MRGGKRYRLTPPPKAGRRPENPAALHVASYWLLVRTPTLPWPSPAAVWPTGLSGADVDAVAMLQHSSWFLQLLGQSMAPSTRDGWRGDRRVARRASGIYDGSLSSATSSEQDVDFLHYRRGYATWSSITEATLSPNPLALTELKDHDKQALH